MASTVVSTTSKRLSEGSWAAIGTASTASARRTESTESGFFIEASPFLSNVGVKKSPEPHGDSGLGRFREGSAWEAHHPAVRPQSQGKDFIKVDVRQQTPRRQT